ncbi:hypothetical protein ACFXG4_43915 [Nocardia sp. NPDC059246]|uniref:hypothetical protein n=1 Tax=unclassified Nocardia TaxID=2637762 RepID=UPI00368F635D
MIRFAVRWAPFGGAPADELLVAFGVSRWRFIQMIRQALRPLASDRKDVQAVKRNFLEVMSWSWQSYPDSSVSPPERQRGMVDE